MSYLHDDTGVVGGMLPAPHDTVRIVVGAHGNDSLFVTYEGSRDALLAAGALDALMDAAEAGRDLQLRPFTKETLPDGNLSIRRTMASLKQAQDLPGLRSGAGNIAPLLPRKPNLRLV